MRRVRSKQIRRYVVDSGIAPGLMNRAARKLRKQYNAATGSQKQQMREAMQ